MTTAERIRQFCLTHGFAEFHPAGTYMPAHSCGVPSGWAIRLRTERAVVDGYHAIYVYPDCVRLCCVRSPVNFADWQTVVTESYDNTHELLAALDTLTRARQASCWA